MSQRVNRRELIIEQATHLFQEQGYQATSTRQIAEAVGCTEAALYYHFRDGKRELLRTVIETRSPEMAPLIDHCGEAASLKEAMLLFSDGLAQRSFRMRWMLAELPHLDGEDRAVVLERFVSLREGLTQVIACYVDDRRLATQLAWMILCQGVGYAQLFSDPGFAERVDLSPQDMIEAWVTVMA